MGGLVRLKRNWSLIYKNHCHEFTIKGHCLLWGIRVVFPAKLQAKVLHELHSGHAGMSRMKSLARSYLRWPKVDRDIEELVKSCHLCLNIRHALAVAPLHPWVWPLNPWQRIHVYFSGPFQGKMYLLAVHVA